MLFSIITITYNAEKYLSETLSSVACQTYQDFEHIVWDGGSRDATLDIARSFKHVSLHVGKDKGISDAMNKGAVLGRGKYLLHLHADDLLAHPYVLEMIAKSIKLHPDTKWLYGKAHILNEEGKLMRTTPHEPFSASRLRKYNFITHPATVIEKDFFHAVGGFEKNLKYTMDYDLWLRLCKFERPITIPAVLACFREHQGSLSTNSPQAVAEEAYRVRNRYVDNLYERVRSYLTWKKRIKGLNEKD